MKRRSFPSLKPTGSSFRLLILLDGTNLGTYIYLDSLIHRRNGVLFTMTDMWVELNIVFLTPTAMVLSASSFPSLWPDILNPMAAY
jgi:hypothetical protein